MRPLPSKKTATPAKKKAPKQKVEPKKRPLNKEKAVTELLHQKDNALGYANQRVHELEAENRSLAAQLREANEAVHAAKVTVNNANEELTARNQQAENEKNIRIVGKSLIVEKLKDGFTVREFTGERTTPRINRTGNIDLQKDVAAEYIDFSTVISEGLSQPVENLLDQCASGAKYYTELKVLQMPQ